MSLRVEAYVTGALWLLGGLITSIVFYFAGDESPTLREFLLVGGPPFAAAIRSLMARSPYDVWDGKTDRRNGS